MSTLPFAFFGTRPLAAGVLEELERAGFIPRLHIESAITKDVMKELKQTEWEFFVVASFGQILPRTFLDIPKRGVLNVHPSLLPRLRGPSPIRSAILQNEQRTGVSIMLLDDKMDHGPIIAQRSVSMDPWPPHGKVMDERMAHEGGKLLADMLPAWIAGEIEAQPQNDDLATYCQEFSKEDGLLDLSDDAHANLRKIRALEGWPGTHTFFERSGKRIRVQIIDAHIEGNVLIVDIVKPEGKREMPYADFLRSGARPIPSV